MNIGDRVRVVDHDDMQLDVLYPGEGTVVDIKAGDVSDMAQTMIGILMPELGSVDTIVLVEMDVTGRNPGSVEWLKSVGQPDRVYPFAPQELRVIEHATEDTHDHGGEG